LIATGVVCTKKQWAIKHINLHSRA